MKKAIPFLLLFAAVLISCSPTSVQISEGDTAGAVRPLKQKFTIRRHVTFTPDQWPKALTGNLYLPENSSSASIRPAVLLIHGGTWAPPSQQDLMGPIAKKLAARGYVVFNITYRLVPLWNYPAPVEDVQEALRWMRRNAESLEIDPRRIATFGYSAGGHLASLVGLMDSPAETSVQAIVAGSPATDLTMHGQSPCVHIFMGGTYENMPEIYREASPVYHVDSQDPPVFLYHASNDRMAPPEHSRRLHAALDVAGVPNEIYWNPDRDHITGFFRARGAVNAAIDFLDRVLRD